jgi:hypothetical protein
MKTGHNNAAISIPYLPSGRVAPAILTGEEVAELLRLEGSASQKERTLKFWRDEGKLVGIRLGKKLRYRLEDVLAFLEQKADVD